MSIWDTYNNVKSDGGGGPQQAQTTPMGMGSNTAASTGSPWGGVNYQNLTDPSQLSNMYGMFGGPSYWASQGYTGGDPSATTRDYITGDVTQADNSGWLSFLKDKGYGYNYGQDADQFRYGQLTQNGTPVSGVDTMRWSQPNNDFFNATRAVTNIGLAYGGAMAAGGGAAGGGAAASSGGMSSADLAALYGPEGYGATGGGLVTSGNAAGAVGGLGASESVGANVGSQLGASEGIEGGTNLFANANASNIPASYSAADTAGGYSLSDAYKAYQTGSKYYNGGKAVVGALGGGSNSSGNGGQVASNSSPYASFVNSLLGGSGSSGGTDWGSLINNGVGAYTAYQSGNRASDAYSNQLQQINSLYAANSPYTTQMQQALDRRDAAAGRNSQYGTRAVELAAALTNSKAQSLLSPTMASYMGSQLNAQNQFPATLNALLNGSGKSGQGSVGSTLGKYLQDLYKGNSSSSSYNPYSGGGDYSGYTTGNEGGDISNWTGSDSDWSNVLGEWGG